MTDASLLNWLLARVTYLEHKDAQGRTAQQQTLGGWWPQLAIDHDPDVGDPDMIDLDLREYVAAQIAKEGD
jgi:hypothetical protein